MSSLRRPLISIIGGIGSGKSAVARALTEFLRVHRLDADAAGHRALLLPEVRCELREAFGENVLDAQGNVIRSRIADQVFGTSPDQVTRREQLNAIVHPRIRQMLIEELDGVDLTTVDVVILDAALALEAGWADLCDAVVFLEVPVAERVARVASRGWSEKELLAREASQWPLDQKRSQSDLVLDNTGDVTQTAKQLAEWIQTRFQQDKLITPSRSASMSP